MKQIHIRFSACKSRTEKYVVKEQPSFCASRRALGGTDDFYFQLGQMRVAAYQNVPDPAGYTQAYIFEGNNLLKRVYCGWEVRYATSWTWTKGETAWAYSGVAASLESVFEKLEYSSANEYQKWYRAEPDARTDERGLRVTYTYDNGGFVTR